MVRGVMYLTHYLRDDSRGLGRKGRGSKATVYSRLTRHEVFSTDETLARRRESRTRNSGSERCFGFELCDGPAGVLGDDLVGIMVGDFAKDADEVGIAAVSHCDDGVAADS